LRIDADEYQDACAETAIYPAEEGVVYTMLGLGNEAGELQGKYKKYLRDNSSWDETKEKIIDELGDVLWYAAMLAKELRVPLSLVMDRNLIKLQSRHARGVIGGSGDNR
jgi:NTP pyrophosphatase (non-canonical NTP hydrolase)